MPANEGRSFTFEARQRAGRRRDGLIQMVHVYHPKFCDLLSWLNRESDALEELRPYRVGMFKRREGECHAERV